MKKILWATDGSKEAERALNYAEYMATKAEASILGVHVIPLPVQLLYENLEDSKEHLNSRRAVIENAVADRFEEVTEKLKKSGIKFEGVILKGKPSDKIREFAKKKKADLIVLGKHGHGFIESMLAGSETIKILKGSHIPVLAIKDESKKRSTRFRNILVPIDLTECSDTAVSYALSLAQITDAKIRVIYVLRLDMYAQDLPVSALQMVIDEAKKDLIQRVAKTKKAYERKKNSSKDIKVATEVIHGMSEAVTISNYARKNNIDLIAIHTHGRSGITKFLLGSVTERVLSSSKCSVLAMKPD